MMDVANLTPAPWTTAPFKMDLESGCTFLSIADAEFIALARNAFDVCMRRGWTAEITESEVPDEEGEKWYVPCPQKTGERWPAVWMRGEMYFADPFTALVEADRWYAENIEAHEVQETPSP